jgi:hypothetical protein
MQQKKKKEKIPHMDIFYDDVFGAMEHNFIHKKWL